MEATFSSLDIPIESSKKGSGSIMRTLIRSVFLSVFVLLSAAAAFGWDDVGHKTTAYIAWQQMSPAARESVIRILRTAPEDSNLSAYYMQYGPESDDVRKLEYFMLVATWADLVRERTFENRYKKYHKSNWHYDDTFWRQVDGKLQVLSGFEEGGVAINRLVDFDKTLRSSAT